MTLTERIRHVWGWIAARRLAGIVILAGGIAGSALIVATGPEAAPQPRTERAWPVSVKTVVPAERSPTLVAFGRVESRQVAQLKTSISAMVASVPASEGSWVDQGDLLVRLDPRELALAVNRAAAEHKRRVAVLTSVRNDFEAAQRMTAHHEELKDIAAAKLERYRELSESRMIAGEVLDEVRRQASERAIALEEHRARLRNFPALVDQHEAMVAESAALLEAARLDVAQTEIRAPFSGRVMETTAAPGDRILPGTVLVRIADYEQLEIRAAVPMDVGNRLRARLGEGARVTAVGEFGAREIPLELVRLAGNVKPGQSGLDAFFRPAHGERLDIGRVMNLTVALPPETRTVAVPVQALYQDNRVYKVVDSRLVAVDAEKVGDYIGADGEYQVLIRSPDLSAGDTLIMTQLPRAISGMLVDPRAAYAFDGAIAAGVTGGEGSG